VSINPDSTFIHWENMYADRPEEDVSIHQLALARPHEDFKVIKARLVVGMDVADMDIRRGLFAKETYYESFAERFVSAFQKHKHELCFEAAKKLVEDASIFIVRMRKPITGEITRY
jgi:hypothetical protein